MSVYKLLERLTEKVLLAETASDLGGEEGSVLALLSSSRKRNDLNRTLKASRKIPYERLLALGSEKTSQVQIKDAIQESLVEVEMKIGNGNIIELVQTLTQPDHKIGEALCHILLSLRNGEEHNRRTELDAGRDTSTVDWWNAGVLLKGQRTQATNSHPDEPLIPREMRKYEQKEFRNMKECIMLDRAVTAVRSTAVCLTGDKPLTSLDRVLLLTRECERILERHRNQSSSIKLKFCAVIENMCAALTEAIQRERNSAESLLQIEKKARPLLNECESIKSILIAVSAGFEQRSDLLASYLDPLYEMAQHENIIAKYSRSKHSVAKQVLETMLEFAVTILDRFFCGDADAGVCNSLRDYASENSNYQEQEQGSLPRSDQFRMIIFLPEILGGGRLSMRLSYIREVHLRFLPEVAPNFIRPLSVRSIELLCNEIEDKVTIKVRGLFVKLARRWWQRLKFGDQENDASNEMRKQEVTFPTEVTRVLERGMVIMLAVRAALGKCAFSFEMHHLIRELCSFFLQTLEFGVFPKLITSLEAATGIEMLHEAMDLAREDLTNLFFLNEDIQYLTLERLLDVAEKGDVAKFRKVRAFFVKCLMNSTTGKPFLDVVDLNGFYRRCAEELNSA